MRAGISAAAAAAVLAAAVSLVATLVAGGRPDLLVLVEAVVMIVLIFLAVRKAPARQALFAASVVGAAEAAMILDAGSSLREGAEAVAFWALAAAGAAGAALYLNALDAQRARSVADARRSQRLELARDLHDFVAHDVSGIVVDAQAGRTVGVDAPEQALAALERIEKDALRALASMDRTVRALHEATGPEQAQTAGLEDLAELTGRFATSSRAQVQLDVAPEALDGLAPEVSATGYRVVVEALSNVRRHAPAAGGVEVAVAPVREGIAVTVTNDGVGANGRADDRDAGFGLIGLRERVEALGGSVSAGPVDADGWRLTAVMPCGDGRRP
ncbi:MAG TPA: histidine kinase [Solirubrobacteraceae bacterium]|nr:histidine kinase [Solirubrobacteraceae bacterium]